MRWVSFFNAEHGGTAGCANYAVVDLEPVIKQVHKVILGATRMAGTPLRATWIGRAGLARPAPPPMGRSA
jgi:hypothetical protein